MSWMISFIYTLLISTFLNIIVFILFEIIFYLIKEKLIARFIYHYLKMLIITQILVLLFNVLSSIYAASYNSVLPLSIPMHVTRQNSQGLLIIIIIWFLGFSTTLIPFLFSIFKFNNKIKSESFEIKDMQIAEIAVSIRREMGIKKDVNILYSNTFSTPVVFNMLRPCILLPIGIKKTADLYVVFFHELTHVKNHDLRFKFIFRILKSIFWFNPIMYILDKLLKQYMEFACDEISCTLGKEYFSYKQYFNTILNIKKRFRGNTVLLSTLYENSSDLERRIKNMKKFTIPTRKSLYFISIISVSTLILCANFSFVVCAKMLNTYNDLAQDENIHIMTTSDSQLLQEYTSTEKRTNGEERISPKRLDDTISIDIATDPDDIFSTVDFYKSSGETVRVTLSFNPEDQNMKVGLYTPTGSTYVISSGSVDHTFKISDDGYYALFIENISNKDVDAIGFAHIR